MLLRRNLACGAVYATKTSIALHAPATTTEVTNADRVCYHPASHLIVQIHVHQALSNLIWLRDIDHGDTSHKTFLWAAESFFFSKNRVFLNLDFGWTHSTPFIRNTDFKKYPFHEQPLRL